MDKELHFVFYKKSKTKKIINQNNSKCQIILNLKS